MENIFHYENLTVQLSLLQMCSSEFTERWLSWKVGTTTLSMNTNFKYNNEYVFTRKLQYTVYTCGERMVVDCARCSSANEHIFWTVFSMTQKVFNSSDQPTSQVLMLSK